MNPTAKATAAHLRAQFPARPVLAMVLGSGFQHALTELRAVREISYGELPGFPRVGVSGHAGRLVFGFLTRLRWSC